MLKPWVLIDAKQDKVQDSWALLKCAKERVSNTSLEKSTAEISKMLDSWDKAILEKKETKMSRFDSIKYDEKAVGLQEWYQEKCIMLEHNINCNLKSPRAKALALTNLEEMYTWIGKAIRDDQIERTGHSEHQPEKGNR